MGLKLAQVLLVVVFGTSPLLPACTADAACTMPCCNQTAPHPGGATAPSPDSGCCPVPDPLPRQIGAGCGIGPMEIDVHLGFSGAFPEAVSSADDFIGAPGAPASCQWIPSGPSTAVKTPIYLRVQTLRI